MSLEDGTPLASLSARSIAAGALAGVAATLFGYLSTGLVVSTEVERTFESIPAWKAVGWYFYNAHFVDLAVEGSVSIGGVGGSGTQNLVVEADEGLVQWLYLAPPVGITLAGGALSRWIGGADGPVSGAARGALVIVGYLPLIAVGALGTAHSVEEEFLFVKASGTIEPQLLPAILIAGVLYPIVFGQLGGALAATIGNRLSR